MKRTRFKKTPMTAADVDARMKRHEWKEAQAPVCMVCETPLDRPALDLHHMAGRNRRRPDLYEDFRNYLLVCNAFANDCHGKLGATNEETCRIAWQAKQKRDAENADLDYLCELQSKFRLLL